MVLYRDMPAAVSPAGSFSVEAFVALDTSNIIAMGNMNANLAIVDLSEYYSEGVVEFYAGVRNDGAPFSIGIESSINAFNNWYNTNTNNRASAGYVRITRDATVPAAPVWNGYYKFNRGDTWIQMAVSPVESQMRNGGIPPNFLRPALNSRNWNGGGRAVSLFSYFRVGPLTCADMGSSRFVNGLITSAQIYGLSQGRAYQFTVVANTLGGRGAFSALSAAVTIPTPSTSTTGLLPPQLSIVSQGKPCSMNSVYSAAYGCTNANDGIGANLAHSACDADSRGGWWQVDLMQTYPIVKITFKDRQDCCQARMDNFQVWVSPNPGFLAADGGTQCDPNQYNPIISSVPGYTQSFPCTQIGTNGATVLYGRYVTIRRNPMNVDCLNIAQVQVFSTTNRVASLKQPCTQSSVEGSNVCQNCFDGVLSTFCSTNNDVNGWVKVDLGSSSVVSTIVFTNRQDNCNPGSGSSIYCQVRNNNLRFYVGENGVGNEQCDPAYIPTTFNNPATTPVPYQYVFSCFKIGSGGLVPLIGRFVQVSYPGVGNANGNYMNIAEIEVDVANFVLASQGKPCTMSSVYGSFTCDYAFNGIFNDFAHTNGDLDDFITVDLGFSSAVQAIKVFDRQDCCQNRLDGAQFFVGDSPSFHQNTQCNPALVPTTFTAAPTYSGGFPCTLTGRYVTIHLKNANLLNMAEMQVFTANYCPPRYGNNTVITPGSQCLNGRYGSVCSMNCLPGYVAVSGLSDATCNGQIWSGPSLMCLPPCPELAGPQYQGSCSQSFFTENFNVDGALSRFVSLSPYTQLLAVPSSSPPQLAKWFQTDGTLQASALLTCASDLHLAMSSATISQYASAFTMTSSVKTSGRAGLFWRAQDQFNMYRFWFDTTLGYAAIEKLVSSIGTGVPTTLTSVFSSAQFTANTWHVVSVSVFNAQINITFDGVPLLQTVDLTYLVGFAGVYSQSSALFDDLSFSANQCTTCQGMTNGDICTFGCAAGLIAANGANAGLPAPVSRQCSGATSPATMAFIPDVVASPLVCTLPAPTFIASTLFVLENSPINANVGDPLVAFASSPDFQVQFQIMAVYAMSAFNQSYNASAVVNQGLFWIDACSGQVKLRTGGQDVMNYEAVNNYVVTVRVFVSGFAGAETRRNITVIVLNQDEPPVVVKTYVTLAENAAQLTSLSSSPNFVWRAASAGTVLGAPVEWDPENSTVAWTWVDGSNGRLTLNSATGVVSVVQALNGTNGSLPVFNFEQLPNSITMVMTAQQTNTSNSLFSSTNQLVVTFVDQNDPPLIARGQVLSLTEYADAANTNTTLQAGTVQAYDEDRTAAFNNGTIIYNLVSGVTSVSACGVAAANHPTDSGLVAGNPLFSINAYTGLVTLVAMPTPAPSALWRYRTPAIFNAQQVRAVYTLCVRTTDVAGATDTQPVSVAIVADVPGIPTVTNVTGLTPDVPTVGGTKIVFGGKNFMPGGTLKPVVAWYSNGARTYNGTGVGGAGTPCVINSDSQITCYTVAGIGGGHVWQIMIDINPVMFVTPPAMNYAQPTVTAVAGPAGLVITGLPVSTATGLFTNGSQTITFTGSNFGPAGSNPVVVYGARYEFPCTYVPVLGAAAHTTVTCLSAQGVGSGLPWTLTVGGQAAASSIANSLTYGLPVITGVTAGSAGVNPQSLDTYGHELLTISGYNFGPASIGASTTVTSPLYGITVQYGGASGSLLTFGVFTASAPAPCTQSTSGLLAHSQITCTSVPWVGTGHRVSLKVAALASSIWPTNVAASNGTACPAPSLHVLCAPTINPRTPPSPSPHPSRRRSFRPPQQVLPAASAAVDLGPGHD